MGGVGWDKGSPEKASDGGLERKKVTDGGADGRSPMGKMWT
jgi:hypothetical protein